MKDPIQRLREQLEKHRQERTAFLEHARQQDAAYTGAIQAIEQAIEAMEDDEVVEGEGAQQS